MTDLALGLNTLALKFLRESDDNPRDISDERYQNLKHSLAEDPSMLAARPLIATPDGQVVCGNMRLRALRDLGVDEAPVYVEDLSAARRREWMLRDNQEYGDWVPEELAALVATHASEDADLQMLGFAEEDLGKLMEIAGEEKPEGEGKPDGNIQPADVWGVVIECETEEEQAGLMEEFTDRGLVARALIP